MPEHIMNLAPIPMQQIKDGGKTIELRLYDEKRKLISVGDIIKFINTEDSNDTLSVTIKDLFVFDSFKELYKHLPLSKCGYDDKNVNDASPDDMNIYYSEEKQSKYGVIGIEISLIPNA